MLGPSVLTYSGALLTRLIKPVFHEQFISMPSRHRLEPLILKTQIELWQIHVVQNIGF